MDDPSRMLSEGLRAEIASIGPIGARSLLDELNAHLPQLWVDLDGFEATPDETEYVDLEPPGDYVLVAGKPIAGALIQQVEETPLRWRSDVLFAVIQYLLFDVLGVDDESVDD